MKTYLTIRVFSPDGRCKLYRRYRSRSLLRNFLRIIGGIISTGMQANGWQISLIPGGSMVSAINTNQNQGNVANGVPNLIWGSGNTPVDEADYQLAASLDSVNASGVSEAISGAQVTETWTGSKANPGPTAWSVNEVGLRVSLFYTNIVRTNVLIIRDVLPATVTVQPGDTLNLQYSITVTA